MYLTILTGVMVIINFIQAAFLDHVHSFMWITIVPLVIFVAALLALFIYAYLSRERLAKEWKEAEGIIHRDAVCSSMIAALTLSSQHRSE